MGKFHKEYLDFILNIKTDIKIDCLYLYRKVFKALTVTWKEIIHSNHGENIYKDNKLRLYALFKQKFNIENIYSLVAEIKEEVFVIQNKQP